MTTVCRVDELDHFLTPSAYDLQGSQEKLTGTVGKIYTPIFSFFRKSVVNITISVLGLVSNERSGNFTFCYRVFTNFRALSYRGKRLRAQKI